MVIIFLLIKKKNYNDNNKNKNNNNKNDTNNHKLHTYQNPALD